MQIYTISLIANLHPDKQLFNCSTLDYNMQAIL